MTSSPLSFEANFSQSWQSLVALKCILKLSLKIYLRRKGVTEHCLTNNKTTSFLGSNIDYKLRFGLMCLALILFWCLISGHRLLVEVRWFQGLASLGQGGVLSLVWAQERQVRVSGAGGCWPQRGVVTSPAQGHGGRGSVVTWSASSIPAMSKPLAQEITICFKEKHCIALKTIQ